MSWLRKKKQSTGLVDLSSLVANLTGGKLWASRSGQLVTLSFDVVTLTSAGDSNHFIATLPVGFRPESSQVMESVQYSSIDSVRSFLIGSTGRVGISTKSDTGTRIRASITYLTNDAWPA